MPTDDAHPSLSFRGRNKFENNEQTTVRISKLARSLCDSQHSDMHFLRRSLGVLPDEWGRPTMQANVRT